MPRLTNPCRPAFLAIRLPAAVGLSLATLLSLSGCKTSEKHAALETAPSKDAVEAAPIEATPARIDSVLAVATFNAAWQYINDTHFDPNFNGVDWNAVAEELRPAAETAQDENELREIIADMLSRLGQSHFVLLPREIVDTLDESNDESTETTETAAATDTSSAPSEADTTVELGDQRHSRDGDLGIKIAIIDDQAVITAVDHAGPAAAAGIETGWVIDEVDNKDLASRYLDNLSEHVDDATARYEAMQRIIARLRGAPDSEVTLKLRDSDDKEITKELTRRQRPGTLIQFGNLPPMNALLEHERVTADNGEQVGVIRFNIWMIPLIKPFGEAMDDLRDTAGIVIDLRGNPGGVGAMAMSLAGHFFNDTGSLGVMKTRAGELNFLISPKRFDANGDMVEPFAGPLAILVDHGTGSTSEIFAAGMQSIGRAHVFGETSAGAALPALMDRLPNGDVLLHAFADFILPNGHSVEGTGVIPDQPVVLTRKDLIGGHDPVLDAAMKWIEQETQKKAVALHLAE